MILLKKANKVAILKVRFKTMTILRAQEDTMSILLLEERTRRRIADTLKRQSKRIYR